MPGVGKVDGKWVLQHVDRRALRGICSAVQDFDLGEAATAVRRSEATSCLAADLAREKPTIWSTSLPSALCKPGPG